MLGPGKHWAGCDRASCRLWDPSLSSSPDNRSLLHQNLSACGPGYARPCHALPTEWKYQKVKSMQCNYLLKIYIYMSTPCVFNRSQRPSIKVMVQIKDDLLLGWFPLDSCDLTHTHTHTWAAIENLTILPASAHREKFKNLAFHNFSISFSSTSYGYEHFLQVFSVVRRL